ncbi:hypothetical protein CGMCC3_g16396 [Colletotrichum fructicola]|nr:uncharacterized protein CGMCC3_g16396 [Colletotrichum fructicola]KAE9567437.1 hypothetical protein CGMCC3_g16396 [Colletotrichum fructicola]
MGDERWSKSIVIFEGITSGILALATTDSAADMLTLREDTSAFHWQ